MGIANFLLILLRLFLSISARSADDRPYTIRLLLLKVLFTNRFRNIKAFIISWVINLNWKGGVIGVF